ncbi:hypothetical protein BLA3211_07933 [Burkholderia aenigmatica]|uniref:Uncharacterized protein n=1 Tax=Burkholderia aenigmatica TaxID=2015348 RepID=A0A6J5JSU4_9BURK|nr:hypothetical protein BLA3211_07933 [Burkholderia aenigmatica]
MPTDPHTPLLTISLLKSAKSGVNAGNKSRYLSLTCSLSEIESPKEIGIGLGWYWFIQSICFAINVYGRFNHCAVCDAMLES